MLSYAIYNFFSLRDFESKTLDVKEKYVARIGALDETLDEVSIKMLSVELGGQWILTSGIDEHDAPQTPVLLSSNLDAEKIALFLNRGIQQCFFGVNVALKAEKHKCLFPWFAVIRKDGVILRGKLHRAYLGMILENQVIAPRDLQRKPIKFYCSGYVIEIKEGQEAYRVIKTNAEDKQ